MGAEIDYESFIQELDKKLSLYFGAYKNEIYCRKGCCECCEKGDYPLSDIELNYLMQGFIELDSKHKSLIQHNIKNIKKGGACPFLINKTCSVYKYRPIICRVHGLAYICKDNVVKLPYCANNNKNFSKNFSNNEFIGKPVSENLDTSNILKRYIKDNGNIIIKNLYDWIRDVI